MPSLPAECRRCQRIHVQIPVLVRGIDAAGTRFIELTKTLDISSTGALLVSPRLPGGGRILSLTIPTPPSPSPLLPAETAPIDAQVRHRRMVGGVHLLGVEFTRELD